MARITKAERDAAEAAKNAALWAEFSAEYNKRLTMLVYDFGRLGHAQFAVRFLPESQEFVLEAEQGWHEKWVFPLTPPVEYDPNLLMYVEVAERAVVRYLQEEERLAEQERKRRAALNKLTDEERQLLGV